MRIFIKYILKSMLERKVRTLLLIFSLAISSGLLIGSLGMVDMVNDTIKAPIFEATGNREILITSNNDNPFMELSKVNQIGVNSFIPSIVLPGKTDEDEPKEVMVNALEDKYIKFDSIMSGRVQDFKGAQCIISYRTSEELGLKIGDTLKLNMNGYNESLKVAAIDTNKGLFYNDSKGSFNIIIPDKYIADKYETDGKYNYIIANKTQKDIKACIKEFNAANNGVIAKNILANGQVDTMAAIMNKLLYIMLLIVVFVSVLITNGAMKVVINERMPMIGTFLSQGSTRFTIKKILYMESVLYGLIGAVLSVPIGNLLLYLINLQSSPLREYGIYNKLNINPQYYLFGLLFSVFISFISCFIPILSINKLVIKDVILNVLSANKDIGWNGFFIGIILFIPSTIGIFLYKTSGIDYNIMVEEVKVILLFILMVTGFMLMLAKSIDVISGFFSKAFRVKGNVFLLAVLNIKNSKISTANTKLIIVAIISIVIIKSMSTSMVNSLGESYNNVHENIEISGISNPLNLTGKDSPVVKMVDEIKKVDGVDINSIQATTLTSYKNGDSVQNIMGIEPKLFSDRYRILELDQGDNKAAYDKFIANPDTTILLSTTQARLFKAKVGEKFKININNIEKEFTIAGFIEEKTFNTGLVSFINLETLKKDFNISTPTEMAFSTTKQEEMVKKAIIPIAKKYGFTVKTLQEVKDANLAQNNSLESIVIYFVYIAIGICILGVMNNVTIIFLQRAKELATYGSTGMSPGQRVTMLIYESVYSALLASFLVTCITVVFTEAISKIISIFMKGYPINMSISLIPIYFGISVLVLVVATLPSIFRNRKFSVVEQLRYE